MKTLADLGLTEGSFTTLVFLYALSAFLIFVLISVFFYLKSYGIYKIARTLRLKGAWRAFVPFSRTALFFEEAQIIQDEKKKVNRKTPLRLIYIAKITFSILAAFIFIRPITKLIFSLDLAVANGTALDPEIFKSFTLTFVLAVVAILFGFIYRIGFCVCLSQVLGYFKTNNPKLVALISFFVPIIIPFVLIIANKKGVKNSDVRIYEKESGAFKFDEQ